MNNRILGKYQAYRWHRRLWNWLAETGAEWKSEWPLWHEIDFDDIFAYDCFPCTYALVQRKKYNGDPRCLYCIFDWGKYNLCPESDSLFDMWGDAENITERKRVAYIIANLPLKPYPNR